MMLAGGDMQRRNLPIGIQTFREIRENGHYYVDERQQPFPEATSLGWRPSVLRRNRTRALAHPGGGHGA
jgi:hypothetical protein